MYHSAANASADPSEWAVVIPSFNHAGDAIACIASLWEATPRPGNVLLIDDASTDAAVSAIADWALLNDIQHRVIPPADLELPYEERPWLTIVAATENAGFVGSCNLGLRYVRDLTDAPFALLLNNDVAVAATFFAELAQAVASHPDVGLLSGCIYEWDRSTVWYAGAHFNPLRALAVHDTVLTDDKEPRLTGYVCGCTMLISRAVLEKVGLLAECFRPCYVEDVDYSLRTRSAGFPVMYAPRAICYHRVGASLGRGEQTPATTYSVNRNRAFALRRNYQGWHRAAGIAYLSVTKPGRALLELAKGRPHIASAVVRGMLAGIFSPCG